MVMKSPITQLELHLFPLTLFQGEGFYVRWLVRDGGCWWCRISTFVTLGFEHSVANMFLIAQGILAGAEITIKEFLLGNMVPVTLGNIVGSAVFVAFAHYWAYGRD